MRAVCPSARAGRIVQTFERVRPGTCASGRRRVDYRPPGEIIGVIRIEEGHSVSATAGSAAGQHGLADKLGMDAGAVVQESGWDEDCDEDLRVLVRERIGSELVEEDYDDVVDVVMMWWREGDGDLV